jgi:hypothetical protein
MAVEGLEDEQTEVKHPLSVCSKQVQFL